MNALTKKNDPLVSRSLSIMYFIFKMSPVVVGLVCIVLGYRLFILGITGQASISVETKTVSGQLINASPGLFFALGGMYLIGIAIYKGWKISTGGGGRILTLWGTQGDVAPLRQDDQSQPSEPREDDAGNAKQSS